MVKILSIVLAMFFYMGCSKLHVIEDEQSSGTSDLEQAAPAVLTDIGFKGAVKAATDENYERAVRIFPGDNVYLGSDIREANSVASASYVLSVAASGQQISQGSLPVDDFNMNENVLFDTTGLIPGVYTLAVTLVDASNNTLTDEIELTVMPKVEITAVRTIGGKLYATLLYPYGVGSSVLSVNSGATVLTGGVVNPNEDTSYTIEKFLLPDGATDGDEIVATVTMNDVDGPNDTAIIGNRIPAFAVANRSASITSCVLQEPDFDQASINLSNKDNSGGRKSNFSWTSPTTATETINGQPAAIMFDPASTNTKFSGSWKTTNGDDDFMGLVFGYKSSQEYYLFDWKRGDQNYVSAGKKGMRIRYINTTSTSSAPTDAALWSAADTAGIQTFAPLNSISWEVGQTYRFVLEQVGLKTTITIYAGYFNTIATLELPLAPKGRMGIYSFSQANNIYSNMHTCSNSSDVAYNYDVGSVIDEDGDSLTYSLVSAPEGVVINSTTGKVTWAYPYDGNHKIVIDVDDSRGGTDRQTLALEVK